MTNLGRDGPDGPLPPLLLALTFVTGMVDAVSFLALGRVFVANITAALGRVFVANITAFRSRWRSSLPRSSLRLSSAMSPACGYASRSSKAWTVS
jgi:hypothetical protein